CRRGLTASDGVSDSENITRTRKLAMPQRPMSFSERAYYRDRLMEVRNLTIVLGMGEAVDSDTRRACKELLPAVDGLLFCLVGEEALGTIRDYPGQVWPA